MDSALTFLDKAENLGGTAPLSKLTRAVTAMNSGNFDEVIALMAGETTGISKLLSPALTAWAYLGKGNTTAAMAALKGTQKNGKIHPMRLLHTALILDALGQTKKAGKTYSALKKLSGLSLRSAQLMGSNFERQGLSMQALAIYEALPSRAESEIIINQARARIAAGTRPLLDVNTAQKGAAEALYGISSVLLAQGSWDSALALTNMALYLRPVFPEAEMIMAAAMEQNKRIEEANVIYAKIPETSPLSWLARQHMAQNYDRLDQTDKAIQSLRTMADKHPNRARPLISLADILRGHERFAEAITVYNEALSRVATPQAKHWGVFYARGICYEQTNQWPKAELDFLQALVLQPDHPMVLNYLGYSWIDQGLHLQKALSMIRKAVELRPRDGYIVDSLGWGLYRMGDYKAAVKSLERATILRPADPLINDHFGDVLWQVGRMREARFQWQRALALDPKSKIADLLREKLKNGLVVSTSPSDVVDPEAK
ncbi:MAG: tetratricopeptide repeat protein [Magnetovibrio sp.]|nr:tetratricopeptide repeat protein [Magnetovibrio sp.]